MLFRSTKGQGFFGPVGHASGKMSTELSLGAGQRTSRAFTHKSDRLYPSMVPTLTPQELDTVVSSDEFPESVYTKARQYAEERLAQGKNPFAQPGEQYPAPGRLDEFLRAYPNAVMSMPDRTVGYQYGASVGPFRAPPEPVESRNPARFKYEDETDEEFLARLGRISGRR